MTKVEAIDIARDILEGYITGNGIDSDVPDYSEAYKVLTKIRNNIQKQNFKNKMKNRKT